MANPFYHLRPNKYVDRQLFVMALERLNSHKQLSGYHYVGFGSYMFDDFKLIHNRLHITNMTSLECDTSIISRAEFNLPYKCINLRTQSSTDFISNEELKDTGNIIWLDYTNPAELGSQFSDYSALLSLLYPMDIIRITLNANPSSLGKPPSVSDIHAKRLEELRSRIDSHLPTNIKPEDLVTKNYPMTLLKCLKKASLSVLRGKYYLLPLMATVYQDGQQMLTFTGIVVDSEIENSIKECFSELDFISCDWDKLNYVTIPELTIKETLAINNKLPSSDARQQIQEAFGFVFDLNKPEELDSYISFYKYYPRFQSVNF